MRTSARCAALTQALALALQHWSSWQVRHHCAGLVWPVQRLFWAGGQEGGRNGCAGRRADLGGGGVWMRPLGCIQAPVPRPHNPDLGCTVCLDLHLLNMHLRLPPMWRLQHRTNLHWIQYQPAMDNTRKRKVNSLGKQIEGQQLPASSPLLSIHPDSAKKETT